MHAAAGSVATGKVADQLRCTNLMSWCRWRREICRILERPKVAGKLKVDLSISISLEKSTFVRLSVIKRGTILVVKVHPKA